MGLLGTVGGMKQGRATMDFQIKRIFRFYCRQRTNGGLRYSKPILLLFFDRLRISFTRLYRSTRKLRVGPADSRMILSEGAIGVKVKASM